MGNYIVKLGDDAYITWSSVVDAPISYIKDRDTAAGLWGEDRIARCDEKGTFLLDGYLGGVTPEGIIAANRAGPNESTLTLNEILECYVDKESCTRFFQNRR